MANTENWTPEEIGEYNDMYSDDYLGYIDDDDVIEDDDYNRDAEDFPGWVR